jgi:hypothetical protein
MLLAPHPEKYRPSGLPDFQGVHAGDGHFEPGHLTFSQTIHEPFPEGLNGLQGVILGQGRPVMFKKHLGMLNQLDVKNPVMGKTPDIKQPIVNNARGEDDKGLQTTGTGHGTLLE